MPLRPRQQPTQKKALQAKNLLQPAQSSGAQIGTVCDYGFFHETSIFNSSLECETEAQAVNAV